MIYLFTVAAPARSGTMWYSRMFTTERSFCYHELTTLLRPYPSDRALLDWFKNHVTDYDFEQSQRRLVLQCYPEYFTRLWERAQFGQHIVGNSDHWTLEFLPGLWILWPDMKFVFSTRNGVNCVQSHFVHRPHFPPTEVLRYELRFQTADFFELCCGIWVEQMALLQRHKEWLHGRAQLVETTLEKLTSEIQEVRRIWNWIGIGEWEKYEERNRRMMNAPANARTNAGGVVEWEEIWKSWTQAQRLAFRAVCGETQVRLGYPLPDR